jgi:hypothetical protein
VNDELEPAGPGGKAYAYAHELREFAAFIEKHPAIAEGRTLAETIVAAEDAMTDLQNIEFAEADDFEEFD